MLTNFTVDGIMQLFRQSVQINGYMWNDWLYRSRAESYVANKTYKWIYDYFVSERVNMSAYQPPNPIELPTVSKDLIEGKKTKFTTADITRLIYATPKYSKWTPAEILPYTSGFNFLDYRGTYERLFSMGVDLKEYAHPDVVLVLGSGGVIEDTKSSQEITPIQLNWQYIGSFFIILFGLVILIRLLKK